MHTWLSPSATRKTCPLDSNTSRRIKGLPVNQCYKLTIWFASQLLLPYHVSRFKSRLHWCLTCTSVDSKWYVSPQKKKNVTVWQRQRVSDEVSPGQFPLNISQHTDSIETVRYLRFCNTGNINADVDGKWSHNDIHQDSRLIPDDRNWNPPPPLPRVPTAYATELPCLAFDTIPIHFPEKNLVRETPLHIPNTFIKHSTLSCSSLKVTLTNLWDIRLYAIYFLR